jgi:hypothetical protein
MDRVAAAFNSERPGPATLPAANSGTHCQGGLREHQSARNAGTQEIRVSSKFAGRINFLAGVYYEKNDWHEDSEVPWIADPASCCFGFGTDPNDRYMFTSGDTVKQKAVFSEVYYDLSEKSR